MNRIAFIGIGNMGSAMALAALKKADPANICIADAYASKAAAFAEEHGCKLAESNSSAAAFGDYVVISVKSFVLADVIGQIAPVLRAQLAEGRKQSLIVIAAGVFLPQIRRMLGEELRDIPLLRMLPTVYALLGCGLMSCTADSSQGETLFEQAKDLMEPAGTFAYMPENQMELASTASGCTPAFTAMFIEAMADGMVEVGMSRDHAMEFVARGVLGGASMVLESGKHPGAIKDSVCSPGGSTIVGVNALEENRFRYAAMEATRRAALKILENLGK